MSANERDFHASNPANFRLDALHYYKYDMLSDKGWQFYLYMVLLPALVIGVLGYFFVCAWVLMLLPIWLLWSHNSLNYKHAREGALCPAKVVSINPDMVAMATNLSYVADKNFPVIHVKLASFRLFAGEPVRLGERLVMVTSYDLGEGEENHDPNAGKFFGVMKCEPVRGMTRNAQTIQRTLDSISEESWRDLDHGLKQIPQPPQPGTYPYEEA